MGLTKRRIDSAKYTGENNSRCVLWDDDPHGLGLRIFPSGRKAFILSYRAAGRKRLMSLGDFGTLTLDLARKRARAELVGVESHNVDPLAEKQRRALEARTGTVKAMYLECLQSKKLKSEKQVLWFGEKFVFPAFGSRPWRDVRRSEIRDWHAGIESNYCANRSLQYLRAAFYWILLAQDDSPGEASRQKRDTRNPAAGIKLRAEHVRQTTLEIADLPKLESAIDAETDDVYLRAYFRFVLATGCRRSEALKLKWKDAQGNAITFRDTKDGGDRTVPLSSYAAALLKNLPKIEGNPYVFVGRRSGAHLQEPNKAWNRIRKRAELPGLRIHDLRRTFGSWLGDGGFTSKQIGTVLGHKTDITSRVYMSLGQQTKQTAVDAVEKLMQKKTTKTRKSRHSKREMQ